MWMYITFFGVLYFLQGATLAYIVNFQKPYLAGYGVSKETLGIFTSLLLIPFIAKVALGYLSDHIPFGSWGARKPYMALGLMTFALSYWMLGGVQPGQNFMLFASLAWMGSLGLALFDTCADGWAVDIASEHDQSTLQAAMVAGKSMGLILMSFGFGWLSDLYGFSFVFQVLSVLAVIVLIIVMSVPYRPRPLKASSLLMLSWRSLWTRFYLFFALFGIVYSIASFGTDGLLTLHLSDVNLLGPFELGKFGMSRGLGALTGTLLYVRFHHHLGLVRSQYVALILLGLGCLLPLANAPFTVSGFVWGLVWGCQEVAYVTLAMRFAQGNWPATFFAISMIFSNLGTSLGEAVAAPLVPWVGYDWIFMGFAILAWSCLLIVPQALKPLRN